MQMGADETVEILASVPNDRLFRAREFDERGSAADNSPPGERIDGNAEILGGLARGIEMSPGRLARIVLHGHGDTSFTLRGATSASDDIVAMPSCAAPSVLERP
jgi:hypothetical protein